jgi:hypothetical protein
MYRTRELPVCNMMLRIPNCLDNRLTDGGKVVSPTHSWLFTPQKHYHFYVSRDYTPGLDWSLD